MKIVPFFYEVNQIEKVFVELSDAERVQTFTLVPFIDSYLSIVKCYNEKSTEVSPRLVIEQSSIKALIIK